MDYSLKKKTVLLGLPCKVKQAEKIQAFVVIGASLILKITLW